MMALGVPNTFSVALFASTNFCVFASTTVTIMGRLFMMASRKTWVWDIVYSFLKFYRIWRRLDREARSSAGIDMAASSSTLAQVDETRAHHFQNDLIEA
ncbi:hypothetical protein [Methylocystis sp. JR02]|uniref:hypothetical protein n=1 Tax=Methylocystis sp. JR02 TaxID=3046284 RepID=UPI0024BA9D2A|nr:hypothetical protein [Methylocystis sp. JR02]MDJ0448493.1 hypothetical protein [Methylocystis sp. JR02]